MEVYVDLNNVSKLLPAVPDRVTEINSLGDFRRLLKAIGEDILQNNIAFHLMLDIGRFIAWIWFRLSVMNKNQWTFGSHFLNFSMAGGWICVAITERVWDVPVCASHLKKAKPLKIESPKYNKETRPGILHSCLDAFSLVQRRYQIFYWRQKNSYSVGDSGEEDLQGLERSPTLGERRERLDSENKVITDCITDISTKSDDQLSNTWSDNLASVKAALLWTLANSSERIKQLRILIVRRKRTVDDLLKQADGDSTKSKFAGGNIRVRSPHGVAYIKQLPLREQQPVIW